MTWQTMAACADAESELFFPPDSDEPQTAAYLRAAYCNTCPVRVECLAEALRTCSVGIWAGTTLGNRRSMKRSDYRNRVGR